ncbi:hypothetical protein EDD11_003279 [Mortierella claussenii]|nr:hypothetical protein EDD11_003279 [Mortierella claussenii]
MERPINGDRYVRTLSHYLRSNQRRLLPPALPTPLPDTNGKTTAAAQARSFVTPADPMAAAYQGMVSSLWSATTAVVNSMTPASLTPGGADTRSRPSERDIYSGMWDGTSTVQPDSSASEALLYTKARLRSPILPLDLYYLLYLLERFEQVGIELEGWEGMSSRTVGDSTPRVIPPSSAKGASGAQEQQTGRPESKKGRTVSSFPPSGAGGTGNANNLNSNGNNDQSSHRPQSIRSNYSTAVSTLTLITGWKQWSTAASLNTNNLTIADEIHFIRKFMEHAPSLRLVAKISPGNHVQGKGRIEGFNADAILTLFNHGQALSASEEGSAVKLPPLLLPLAAIFPSLTHLELHSIPPDCIEGWETLMKQLRSLVISQSGAEDVHDIIVTAVVNSERRRRQRKLREKARAVQIKEEQNEALKDATIATQEREDDTTALEGSDGHKVDDDGNAHTGVSTVQSNGISSAKPNRDEMERRTQQVGSGGDDDDDATILSSLRMWPVLHHLSLSDNSFPALTHVNTFVYTPSVVSLDLSHNLFLSPPSGLIHLHNLNDLNLSYNMISGVQSIYQILGNISVLDLRGNRLESLSGLERLWNLEKVDVRENHLDEAAEVGRLAALPCIREVWSERNPFCIIQPKYRLEILAVFKANGHDLLLDGASASFVEKRMLANMSPSSFSTTISSINNVANIPAASAPVATFAQELNHSPNYPSSHLQPHSATGKSLNAAQNASTTRAGPHSPIGKLVKKKLVKSNKRVKRVVNLDSDHEEEYEVVHAVSPPILADVDVEELNALHDDEVAAITANSSGGVLQPPAVIKKKKKGIKVARGTEGDGHVDENADGHSHGDTQSPSHRKEKDASGNGKAKKRVQKKKTATAIASESPTASSEGTGASAGAGVSFVNGDDQDLNLDHSLCHDGHHVHRHRLAHLEKSLASLQMERPAGASGHQRQPSRGTLKKSHSLPPNAATNNTAANVGRNSPGGHHIYGGNRAYGPNGSGNSGAISPRLRPSSPIGSFSSDDNGGADGYRRKIEAMRNEAGKNWLMVLAEMDAETG